MVIAKFEVLCVAQLSWNYKL